MQLLLPVKEDFAVDRGYYRDLQLVKMQGIREHGVANPKWNTYTTPAPKVQRTLSKEKWRGWTDGSVFKSTCYSYRGSGFETQSTYMVVNSHLSLPALTDLLLCSEICGH